MGSGEKIKLPEVISGYWLPDSKSIVFLKADTELWKLDIAANRTIKIADFSPSLPTAFAVSPDNQKYVLSLGNYTSEAVLIENFLGDKTK